jgi:hypothetical protein
MNLDLRFNGKLNKEASLILDDIVRHKRNSFTKIIDNLSVNFEKNLDWHLSGPASRNTFLSPFFYYYCSFYLVEHFLNNNKNISLIIIDSFALENILNNYLKLRGQKIPIKNIKNNIISRLFSFIKPYLLISTEFSRLISQFFCANVTKQINIKKFNNQQGITIIDIFSFPGFITKDRYYNGLWENLSVIKKENTYFVPTIVLVPIKNMFETFRKLRKSEKNYLIKEDFLNINDLLYSISHYFRIKNINIPTINVLNIDISPLISEEIRSMRSYSSSIIGLLNYRFAKNLKTQGIKLNLIIDWFENQVIDKGWNAGFNKYYSSTRSIGYSGQIPSLNYLCSFPSTSDFNLSLLPFEIAVTGKSLIERTKKYSKKLNVIIAPAFRFKHLWEQNTFKIDKDCFTILITLSQFQDQTINMLKMVQQFAENSNIANIRYLVKPHPSIEEKKIKKWWREKWPKNFIIIEGDFSEILLKSNLLISGMSSVCLETIAMGVPLIIIENISGLQFNSVPEKLSSDMLKKCHSSLDLEKSINYFQSKGIDDVSKNNEMASNIKKNYFKKVTKDSVSDFLNIKK